MSETQNPQVRADEPELSDEALEQVAGGCQWGDSGPGSTLNTMNTLTTTEPILPLVPTICN